MKAKHIRKLRKRINNFGYYTIRESFGLFGDFQGYNRMGFKCHDTKIFAESPTMAIEKYMKIYRRKMKKKNEHECEEYQEVTEDWGRIMVSNEKFTWFYR